MSSQLNGGNFRHVFKVEKAIYVTSVLPQSHVGVVGQHSLNETRVTSQFIYCRNDQSTGLIAG